MYKILLIYPTFAIALLFVTVAFITSTSFTQLGVAIILYPLLVFFAYKIFKGESLQVRRVYPSEHPSTTEQHVKSKKKIEDTKEKNIEVTDINKRAFLKIVGATGLSFFLISTFGRTIQSLLSGQTLTQIPTPIGNPQNSQANGPKTSPTDEYKISEVDDDIISFYGFINKNGDWFIMKGDTNSGTFRYAKGTSNFPENWKKRKNLKYDYYDNTFKD
ncbi:hypothetical protein HYT32_02075 [Candidatus Roizmanbacteria bacterium]|nr:hypothetical protein [Candidatus Roizmanbacteria bacterium]